MSDLAESAAAERARQIAERASVILRSHQSGEHWVTARLDELQIIPGPSSEFNESLFDVSVSWTLDNGRKGSAHWRDFDLPHTELPHAEEDVDTDADILSQNILILVAEAISTEGSPSS